ncbi:MAG: threonine synthase [Candidatus Nealsonbacteria bacterium CG23_combo_of_CG06-09_8_20_14_all_36_12]|uniref:Threonine synthase n=1 Tax=Candidatus Nealsonbacteria bacterium CG23_combo_of_CG06-09_8_20_14_all_36_12 TaxID=1974718 RepID=A0A2G9Z0S8_9BACT|nr:MAG: threonine synthase [Candidatus Nealsonbacteria bacterium CG23_combo_of_CG06-09_8_20_14_all_36_12]
MQRPFTIEQSWLSCIGCGYRTDLLDERKFRCPKCGNLYDIEHDFALLNKNLRDYIRTFEIRAALITAHTEDPANNSGVWRFKEWIMPFMPDNLIISLNEGNVPIVRAGKNLRDWVGDVDLYIIMEGMTPSGSFKDFGGTVMMSVANAAGIKAVGCASTGDTSAMAAAYAAAAGIQCFVILPKGKITAIQLAQPLVYGARIILLPGDFDECMRVMQELVAEYGVYPVNSLHPARIEGHQATVFQIAQYFNWELPEWIVVPIGNGSNCSSVGKAMRLMEKFGFKKISRILGCQAEAANPLGRSWNLVQKDGQVFLEEWKAKYQPIKVGETAATAARIGNPVSRDKVMREIVHSHGTMQVATEHDLNEAVSVCGRDGHFVCPQTGIALAGVRNAINNDWIKRGERVVVVSTATGLKFTEAAVAHLQHNIISVSDCKTGTVVGILQR